MNFRKFLTQQHLKMNEFEQGDAGTPPPQSSYDDDLAEIMGEMGSDNEAEDSSRDDSFSLDENSEENNEIEKRNDDLISQFLEDSGAKEGQPEENEEDESGWLSDINSLNLTHDGKTFEVQSPEHVKELIQKGYDYTVKTQNLAEERKAWESEMSEKTSAFEAKEKELMNNINTYQDQLQDVQIMEQVLTQLKSEDPDLLEDIAARYNVIKGQYSNPVFKNQLNQFNQKIQELESGQQKERAALAAKEFDLEIQGSQSLMDQLKDTLGLEIDKNVIQKRWLEGEDVKKAIFAEYGERIMKLQQSKNKVQKTKAATSKKVVTGAGRARTSGGSPVKSIDYSKSYSDIVQDLGAMLN